MKSPRESCPSLILSGLILGFINHKLNQSRVRNVSVAYASLDDHNAVHSRADLKQMKKIAAKYSHLQSHLDAPLAQESLNQKDIKTSLALSKRIQSRLAPNLELILAFNETTFLIAQKKYADALKCSNSLKEKIDSEKMPILYAYHLLRVASLEKALGNEESYREHLKEFTACHANISQSGSLKLGQLSLGDFISKGSRLR